MEYKSRVQDDVQVLKLFGSFDVNMASSVRKQLEVAVEHGPARLVVNLTNVHFLDSTGLSTLVHGKKLANANEGDLHLCGLQQPVRMIFELTRLDKVFEIYIGEEEAIKAFS